jgi:hypothetical protein
MELEVLRQGYYHIRYKTFWGWNYLKYQDYHAEDDFGSYPFKLRKQDALKVIRFFKLSKNKPKTIDYSVIHRFRKQLNLEMELY